MPAPPSERRSSEGGHRTTSPHRFTSPGTTAAARRGSPATTDGNPVGRRGLFRQSLSRERCASLARQLLAGPARQAPQVLRRQLLGLVQRVVKTDALPSAVAGPILRRASVL